MVRQPVDATNLYNFQLELVLCLQMFYTFVFAPKLEFLLSPWLVSRLISMF